MFECQQEEVALVGSAVLVCLCVLLPSLSLPPPFGDHGCSPWAFSSLDVPLSCGECTGPLYLPPPASRALVVVTPQGGMWISDCYFKTIKIHHHMYGFVYFLAKCSEPESKRTCFMTKFSKQIMIYHHQNSILRQLSLHEITLTHIFKLMNVFIWS